MTRPALRLIRRDERVPVVYCPAEGAEPCRLPIGHGGAHIGKITGCCWFWIGGTPNPDRRKP